MYLKRLTINGFKSFNEKTILEFDKGITAVVGPNGSGKSNIADAVRWALGEGSVKTLRGGRMEDLIFGGTENRRAAPFAEVVLVLDNSFGEFKSAGVGEAEFGAEVSVGRRLYRSGESQYLINGVNVRQKDVREMFMDTGLGKEGYSIIGQGRVEDVLSANADTRRALFDEACGITKFKSRKDEALSKIAKENQSLERTADIINEIEDRLEPLGEQAELAKKYLDLSERLKAVKIASYVLFLDSFEEREKRAKENVDDLLSSLKSAEEKKIQCSAEAENVRASMALLAKEIEETAKKREEATLLITNIENDIKMQKIQLDYTDERKARVLKDIEASGAAAAALDGEALSFLDKQAEITAEIIDKDEEVSALKIKLDAAEMGLLDSESSLGAESEKHLESLKAVNDIRAHAEALSASYAELENRKETFLDERAALDSERDKRSIHVQAVSDEKNRAAQDLSALKENIGRYSGHKEKLSATYGEEKGLHKACLQSLADSKNRHKVLEDLEKNREGYGYSVKAVLDAASGGRLTGVLGAVGDLFEARAGYETALEVALGGQVSDIVVENEGAAKSCIEFLKSTRSGRATFLPLTTIKPRDLGRDSDRLLSEPGILGAAEDFVNTTTEVTKITKSLLGRTIVAENFDFAVKFSKKYGYSHKIVTLSGEVINPGGSMSGGSKDKRFGVLSRRNELVSLRETIENLEKTASERNVVLDDLSAKLSGTSDLLERTKVSYHELEIKHTQLEAVLSGEAAALAEVVRRIENSEKTDAELLSRLSDLNSQLREQRRLQKEAEEGIGGLLALIKDKQENVSENRKIKESIEKSLNTANNALSRLIDDAERARKSAEKAKEAADKSRDEAAAYADALSALDIEKETGLENVERLEEKKLTANSQKDELEEVSSGLNMKKAECESEQLGFLQAEQEAYRLENRLNLELERLRLNEEAIQNEKTRFNNEMWEEYEITPKQARELLLKNPQEGSAAALKRREQGLKSELRELGGTVNVGAVEEYRLLLERYGFMKKQQDDILLAKERLNEIVEILDKEMGEKFLDEFHKINENFGVVFAEMFGGGSASLALSDEKNILGSGVDIMAKPPGKSITSMNLLSGGERALSAIALLFAILRLRPAPFCVLDEIETALDDANVRRFARFLKNHGMDSQFILITHRKGTMETADALFGVTMQEVGVSKLVGVKLEEQAEKEDEAS